MTTFRVQNAGPKIFLCLDPDITKELTCASEFLVFMTDEPYHYLKSSLSEYPFNPVDFCTEKDVLEWIEVNQIEEEFYDEEEEKTVILVQRETQTIYSGRDTPSDEAITGVSHG